MANTFITSEIQERAVTVFLHRADGNAEPLLGRVKFADDTHVKMLVTNGESGTDYLCVIPWSSIVFVIYHDEP